MSDTPLEFYDAQAQQDVDVPVQKEWAILVVDDDADVHTVTEFVMHGVSILGRKLKFLHAYRTREAIDILKSEKEIAVILLDVVMEREDAGLRLVRTVRDELRIEATRIILRTGQPGYAPEFEAIRDYDINDYRTKAELSYSRLLTSLTTAIRSYIQIRTIADNKRGLEFILQSINELLSRTTPDSFSAELSREMLGILPGIAEIHVFSTKTPEVLSLQDVDLLYVLRDGESVPLPDPVVEALSDYEKERIKSTFSRNATQFGSDWTCIFLQGTAEQNICAYVRLTEPLSIDQKNLVEIFALASSMGFQNMLLLNRLRTLAFRDATTDLLNRTGFIATLNDFEAQELAGYSILLVDIEGFSEINEVFGHDFGDDLLVAISRRLKESLEDCVTLGRVGADCFALLGFGDSVAVPLVTALFAQAFTVHGHTMHLRIACGMVSCDTVKGDGTDLVKDAFIAVKLAKLQKHSRFFQYSMSLEDDARKKLSLLEQLQSSLLNGGLEVHYQPQVRLDDGTFAGLEALIRWKGAHGVMIPPSEFIPLAEQSGLIVEIGDWVIQKVLEHSRKWLDMNVDIPRIAINVSLRQFFNPGFISNLQTIIATSRVPLDKFELEITESIAMHDTSLMLKHLHALKAMGFLLSIDDFGTGFSSLSYLQALPIDKLKIDRSFIQAIHEDSKNQAIAELIVALAKSLDLLVVAEGVELVEQSRILNAIGCHVAQGYLYARPMDFDMITKWISDPSDPRA